MQSRPFPLFSHNAVADIHCDFHEERCVELAIADLANDIHKVKGERPLIRRVLGVGSVGHTLVIGTLGLPGFESFLHEQGIAPGSIRGAWERFALISFGTEGQHLCLAGSDCRGTMWGIYHLCEAYLGIDPAYLWTDHSPEPKQDCYIEALADGSPPLPFQFRGWFLNDEDLLSEWKSGGGHRSIDYKFYSQITHPDVLDQVLETALRFRQNLVIPASFIDIMNPCEAELVRKVTERGLFVSQHHVEPLGVSHFAWDNYWKSRGESVAPSFVTHPEKFEQIWQDYVREWARFGNIIWQLGLRGKADQPVWDADSAVPSSDAERGALISSAMRKQQEIVRAHLGDKRSWFSTTLWLEGSQLHRDGHLCFPDDTIVVFADDGMIQMMDEDFQTVERLPAQQYGVYYHVACFGSGPHLAQGTSLGKIYHNYKQIIASGDTTYSILNVSNIRELILGIEAVSRLTCATAEETPKEFLKAWCERQFGEPHAAAAAALYQNLFDAYIVRDDTALPDHYIVLDGMLRLIAGQAMNVLHGYVWEPKVEFQKRVLNIGSPDDFLDYYEDATAQALPRWYVLHSRINALLPVVPADRKPFLMANLYVQVRILIGLHEHVHYLCKAAKARRDGAAPETLLRHLAKCVYALQIACASRDLASQGKWRHWYRGDRKMDLTQMLQGAEEALRKYST